MPVPPAPAPTSHNDKVSDVGRTTVDESSCASDLLDDSGDDPGDRVTDPASNVRLAADPISM
ncbi:MAG: hypothetical protein CM1200mP2_02960 [Planctomycetaceae bacterium]|nr:MAG: hypothetical protein CM1200mP2_02960 [Planctomycetaceae bacterium]